MSDNLNGRIFWNLGARSYLLITLAVVLAVGMFLNSLMLAKQMQSLQSIIPFSSSAQKMDTKMTVLRGQIKKYSENTGKEVSKEDIVATLIVVRDLVNDQTDQVKDEKTKSNFLRAGILLDELVDRSGKLPREKFANTVKDTVSKVDVLINVSTYRYEMSMTANKAIDAANSIIIYTFLVALLVGGGLSVGTAYHFYTVHSHRQKIGELVKIAMFDEQTGLYNKAYLEQRLVEAMNRVVRFGKPVAAVMIKVEPPHALDHLSFPVILKEVAGRIIKSTRVYDVNTKYSQDIFCSLIHEVSEKEAAIVLTRLKNACEKNEIKGSARQVKEGLSPVGRFLHKAFNRPRAFESYIRVLGSAVVYADGKLSATEILQRAESALSDAEVSKDRMKIITIKGTETNVKKEKK